LDEHVRGWWNQDLHRAGESEVRNDPDGTLLFLPYPYSTAAGSEAAFPEMYCWDTFFINLGLLAHGRTDIVRHHILNQLFQVQRHGFVPNGNRTFYLTRSQVPLLGESVRRYVEATGDWEMASRALPLLETEYMGYWSSPPHHTAEGLATCTDSGDPRRRPELAAEAEAGLDFTAIFGGRADHCVPIHVNCTLVRYARALAWISSGLGLRRESSAWTKLADARAERVLQFCWDERSAFFLEYDRVRGERLPFWSLCAYWTLWAGIASERQARALVEHLQRFEKPHGLSFTPEPYPSPHPEYDWVQWNYPSGWPPLHMVVVEGLDRYGYIKEAVGIASRFLRLQIEIFERTGHLWEKYNVVDGSLSFPRERYDVPSVHGWSSASVAMLGRRAFDQRVPGSSTP
jgi:alpha,alpha-trehalase